MLTNELSKITNKSTRREKNEKQIRKTEYAKKIVSGLEITRHRNGERSSEKGMRRAAKKWAVGILLETDH